MGWEDAPLADAVTNTAPQQEVSQPAWMNAPITGGPSGMGDGSSLSAARSPSGQIYPNYDGAEKTLRTGLQAANEGASGVLDMIGWPVRSAMNGGIDLWNQATGGNVGHIPTITERQTAIGNIGNPNLTPDSTWSIPEKRGYSTLKGAASGVPFGPAGMIGGAMAENSGDTAKELGWSPAGQVVASLAGGVGGGRVAETGLNALGSASGLGRFTPRGTPSQLYQDYVTEGITPRLAGDVSGSPFAQWTQNSLGNLPGSAGRITSTAKATVDDLANAVDSRAGTLGSATTIQDAGTSLQKGGANWLDRTKQGVKDAYDNMRMYIGDGDQIPLTNTRAQLTNLTSNMKDMPGTAGYLTPNFYTGLKSNIESDLAKLQPQPTTTISNPYGIPGAGSTVTTPPSAPPVLGPSYDTVKQIRTAIGEKLADPAIIDDANRADLKRLYGSLSQDLEAAAQAKGPGALAAMKNANAQAQAMYGNVEGVMKNILQKGATPESILSYAQNSDATNLGKILSNYTPQEKGMLQSYWMRSLGRAPDGVQNAAGDVFSPSAFVTNWNKLNRSGKTDVLFDGVDPELRDGLNRLANISGSMKDTSRLANNSKTAGTLAFMGLLEGGASATGAAIGTGAGIGGVAGAVGGAVIAPVAVPFAASRLMTNPAFVKWLATPTSPQAVNMRLKGLAGVAAANPAIAPDIQAFQQYATDQLGQGDK